MSGISGSIPLPPGSESMNTSLFAPRDSQNKSSNPKDKSSNENGTKTASTRDIPTAEYEALRKDFNKKVVKLSHFIY